jgi:cell division protein FtsI (penicillin-binding protein 3)
MKRPDDAVLMVRGRIAATAALCAAAFSIVVARLFEVMVFGAGLSTADLAPSARPMRADIVDRNGTLIARDLPVSDLYASPAAFWDTEEAARELASTTGADEKRLRETFAAKRGYILVARGLTPDLRDNVMSLGIPGLTFESGYRRYYPSGRIVSHAVGQVDSDDKGVSGLELGLNSELQGKTDGPVQLSLDMRVQYALEHEITEAAETFTAKAAGGIVLDVHTGEVLALASFPNYEPNVRKLSPGDSTRNRLTQDVYELGSIFKIFAFSEAIEEKTIKLDEYLNVGKPLKFGRFQIHDFEHLGPYITASSVFAESSNIGTAQIHMRSGPEKQKPFLEHLGLLDPVKTELPEVASPLYPHNWNQVEGVTISYGQGISVNPLGFAAAAASIVNGGTKVTPTFLKRDHVAQGERVVSESTSATMRQLMRLVVTNGTGKMANIPGYNVGGKTGTAEKPYNGSYARHLLISSFCGVFPIEDPRYLVFIMMDEPHGTKASAGFATGGWTAAPAVGRVIARIAPLLGVPRNDLDALNGGTIAAANP